MCVAQVPCQLYLDRELTYLALDGRRQDKVVLFLEKQMECYSRLNNGANGLSKSLLSLVIYLLYMGDEVRAQSVFQQGMDQGHWVKDELMAATALLDAFEQQDVAGIEKARTMQIINFLDPPLIRIARNLEITPLPAPSGAQNPIGSDKPATIPGFSPSKLPFGSTTMLPNAILNANPLPEVPLPKPIPMQSNPSGTSSSISGVPIPGLDPSPMSISSTPMQGLESHLPPLIPSAGTVPIPGLSSSRPPVPERPKEDDEEGFC
jgi:hypothetical protein